MEEAGQLLVIGDTIFDNYFVLDAKVFDKFGSYSRQKAKLCLNFPDKIPVSATHTSLGGNAPNVAVGTRRLGVACGLWTIVGKDSLGDLAETKLKKEKVNLKYFQRQDSPTSTSAIICFGSDRTALVNHASKRYDFEVKEKFNWLYLTSLRRGNDRIYNQISRYLRLHNAKLVYQPGSQQLLSGKELNRAILSQSYVYISNIQEAEEMLALLGKAPSNPTQAMRQIRALGPSLVVLTNGAQGSYAFDGRQIFRRKVVCPVKVVDRSGAGDALASGFIAGQILDKSLATSLDWGAKNAESVIGKIGTQQGLLKEIK